MVLAFSFFIFLSSLRAGLSFAEDGPPLVFVDNEIILLSEPPLQKGEAELSVLGNEGWEKAEKVPLLFDKGRARVRPLKAGLHRLLFAGGELRFLALPIPPSLTASAVGKTLPRKGGKLFGQESYTILALGDSVTATGSYARMLAKMLERATGNRHIRVEIRAHPGKSIDASVRNWSKDVKDLHPDLALIMYGLNDQAASSPLVAYGEQLDWLVKKTRDDFSADVIFLKPTPHLAVSENGKEAVQTAAASIFRTAVHGALVEERAATWNIPVAQTFDALWGKGGPDLEEAAKRQWIHFPPHFRRQYESLVETEGCGDGIHPNAFGHSTMALAVFEAIAGRRPQKRLRITGSTSWENKSPVSRLQVVNHSETAYEGILRVYPFPGQDVFQTFPCSLVPGESVVFLVKWPSFQKENDLLAEPLLSVFRYPGPFLQVVEISGNQSRVSAVAVPWKPAFGFVAERHVVQGHEASAILKATSGFKTIPVVIPEKNEVGRIPLRAEEVVDGESVIAVAELAYTRFATALKRDILIDGDLSDWKGCSDFAVGEPVQARWLRGPEDKRGNARECYLKWRIACGEKGISLSFSASGAIEKDRFTILFDPRPAEELGSAGPYFWVEGSLKPGGDLALKAGDSSPVSTGLAGAWRTSEQSTDGELFIPFHVLVIKKWPDSGDLGLSIIWKHFGKSGEATTLMWAENGHPWNPRWFGVARLEPKGELPYRTRVE